MAKDNIIDMQEAGRRRIPKPIWAGSAAPRIGEKALVRGVIVPESMIVTYGESGSSKTTHLLDRDMHTAAGMPWYGRECARGLVAYVAAEGSHSAINRAVALRDDRFREPDTEAPPLAILPYQPDLLTPDGDTALFIDYLRRLSDEHELPLLKVTFDTLSRVMAGGNENAPDDMTAVIRNADRIRERLSCAVELVHHAGKDSARGARGHSSLRAATDTEIEVTNREGYCIAKVTKQRDLPTGDEFAYKLRTIELGTDAYGYPVTTVIPDPIMDHQPRTPEKRLSDQVKKLLWLLKEGIEARGTLPPRDVMQRADRPPAPGQKGMTRDAIHTWVAERGGISDADTPGAAKKAVNRGLLTLQEKGLAYVFLDFAWLMNRKGD